MSDTTHIDPKGDITIVLGTQKVLVNSTCLRLASPVFGVDMGCVGHGFGMYWKSDVL